MEILTCGCYVIALSKNTCGILLFVFFTCRYDYLKAHFHPCCNARRELISCDSKFQDYWKPGSKIVFLKSYPVHIVNCFTVNTLTVHHFTVSLQYFEFLSSKVRREFFFKWHAWISTYSVNRIGETDNVRVFSLSRGAWGF